MIVVTGGAGFIGSNLVRGLNERGREDLLVIDDVRDGRKLQNLVDCRIYDLADKDSFREWLNVDRDLGEPIDAVFHQGACTDTTATDGRMMMAANYEYSKSLLSYCTARQIPLIYASSAAVYGAGDAFAEEPRNERALNPYAYSKLLFDQLTRRLRPRFRSQVAGLRYFNAYGPGESHKDEMASMAYRLYRQLRDTGRARLFEGTGGYADGDQRRDFVWVGDCVAVNLWLLEHPDQGGIFNVGTGRARSFNELAGAVARAAGDGGIDYVPLPESLRGRYQSFTQADLGALRKAGYEAPFVPIEEGVSRYVEWLATHEGT